MHPVKMNSAENPPPSGMSDFEKHRHVFFAIPNSAASNRADNDSYINNVDSNFEYFVTALRQTGVLLDYPATMRFHDGEINNVEVSVNIFHLNGMEAIVTMVREMIERLFSKQELNQYNQHLTHVVNMRANELQKANEEMRETNRKLEEAHNQLLQSEKLASIGQLAAGVAHEINNPISFVDSNLSSLEGYLRGILDVLAEYESHDNLLAKNFPEQFKRMQAIKEKVELNYLKEDIVSLMSESKDGLLRVKKIVHDLKDFSHVGTAEWQMADLHTGLDSTLNLVNNEIKYKAKVIRQYGPIPPIECLPLELNQVFMNILVNAAQAINEHGEITVRTSQHDDQVLVEIADNGGGIAPENLKRIFDPFFTTKPVGKGTGLGLSLSYSIIQKHQGRIEVESSVGQNTCFKIWLPIQQKHD